MSNRVLQVFNACYLAFVECREKKVQDKDVFILLAKQYGHINKITKEEIESMMNHPIKDLLEL